MKKKNIMKDKSLNTIKTVVFALLIAIFIRTFIYEPFYIPSGSMKPTLIEGDFILVSKFRYGYSKHTLPLSLPLIKGRIFNYIKPKRGEVIVFRLPRDTKTYYIKRLIGLPGDKIELINDVLFINGERIDRRYVGEYFDKKNEKNLLKYNEFLDDKKIYNILQEKNVIDKVVENKEYIIPENNYFFLGDNRDNSLDSRFSETGFVPYENIIGKADIIFFSKDKGLINFLKLRFSRFFNTIK